MSAKEKSSQKNPDLLTDAEAAAFLGLKAPGTLATWRCKKFGPPYVRIGRNIRYRLEALERYLDRNTFKPEQPA